ncbi:MAG: glycosyl transferase family 2 [Planctomycetaceae bacterium]|nr:glycosyl transferase family 2 [Planctomycetaceae bacterium]
MTSLIQALAESSVAELVAAWAPALRWPLTSAYLLILLLVCIYGLHRYWLVWLYYRTRGRFPRARRRLADLPVVTVQLPMYNEDLVAERIIEAACNIDYPPDKLEIQVLDDSTDQSAHIARQCARRMRDRGHDVSYIHRIDRVGFKAGALDAGLKVAKGDLIAIFDADFVPRPSILKRTVHHFADPVIGMVQVCWDHLNRCTSMLTRAQAIFLDGHFVIEQTARNRSGRWMNFNGTAGVWRKQAIEAAGGWQHDTLTEDMDLSYRAQLAGWKFIFLQRTRCPAELPPEINSFKTQQHRWTKGTVQSARKLLWPILTSDAPRRVKIEAFFHLTSPMVYLYVVLMTLLFFPAFFINMTVVERGSMAGVLFGVSLFTLACASAGTFYTVSQRERKRSTAAAILQIPVLMSIGIGISLNNARAAIEGLIGHDSPFVRTPKFNATDADRSWRRGRRSVLPPMKFTMPLLEIFMGVYLVICIALAVTTAHENRSVVSVPFLILFAAGYWYVGLSSLSGIWRRPAPRAPAVEPAPIPAPESIKS